MIFAFLVLLKEPYSCMLELYDMTPAVPGVRYAHCTLQRWLHSLPPTTRNPYMLLQGRLEWMLAPTPEALAVINAVLGTPSTLGDLFHIRTGIATLKDCYYHATKRPVTSRHIRLRQMASLLSLLTCCVLRANRLSRVTPTPRS